MPAFSLMSRNRLDTCDRRLVLIAEEAIKHVDFLIACGYRNQVDQDAAFAAGKSQLKYPQSTHNAALFLGDGRIKPDSHAFDFMPWPLDPAGKEDMRRYAFIAGFLKAVAIGMGIRLRWGGDWNGNGVITDEHLQDLGHIELE